MKGRKNLAYFLLLNIAISALTTWVVLSIWTRTHPLAVTLDGSALPTRPVWTQESQPPSAEDVEGGSEAEGNSGASGGSVAGQFAIERVVGAGDVENEYVLIKRLGDQEISLLGWRLADTDGNEYVFPNLSIVVKDGAVRVYTKVGTDTPVELYWGLNHPVWSSGDVASLLDPDGTPQASFEVP